MHRVLRRILVPTAVLALVLSGAGAGPVAALGAPARPPADVGARPATAHDLRGVSRDIWRRHRATVRPAAGANVRPHTAAQRLRQSLDAQPGSPTRAEVTVRGTSTTALRHAVGAAGGRVLAAMPGTAGSSSSGKVTAVVPRARLDAVRAAPAVTAVDQPNRAWPQASGLTSEGVAASGADTWSGGGDDGSGVTVGIVDGGFGGLADAVAAGDLPAGLTIEAADNHCSDVDASEHGTAVAEIVHQMAPGATLRLYCIDDSVGMNSAVTQVIADHVAVVNCALGFPADSRGDGTGPSGSAAVAVARARRAGVLWVESAGNSGADHWSGTFADSDRDGLADIDGADDPEDGVIVLGRHHNGGAPGQAGVYLRFDQWPTSSAPVTLEALGYQCSDDDCAAGPTAINGGRPVVSQQVDGTSPVVYLPLTNSTSYEQIWYVYVELGKGYPAVHYDLDYEGAVGQSRLSYEYPARAAAGSISQPADSPYVLAVGAADVGAGDGTARGTLEAFSSQGPTIDRRPKPEILGWDGVSSPVYGAPADGGGFYGTSAAAPHVAGAAALVKAANPGMDAAQLQYFLEQRAGSGHPTNPTSNLVGHGLLTLGADSGVGPPAGSGYTPVTPTVFYDSRHTSPPARFGAGTIRTITVPGLPAGATAVAINLTGISASAKTYLSAYPAGTAFAGTSNLVLSPTDPSAGVFAIVPVPASHQISIRNSGGTVDVAISELGYFATSGTGLLTSLPTGRRVLDTRNTIGGHHADLGNAQTVAVRPAVPADATAVLVNVFAIAPTRTGYLRVGPDCANVRSTVSYVTHTRGNLALVALNGPGAAFCVQNVGPAVDVAVDVVGYVGQSGSAYHPLPAAQTIVDTRTGNGGSAGQHPSRPLAGGTSTIFQGSAVGDVPAGTTALFTGLVEPGNTGGSYLGVFAGSAKPSVVQSALSYSNARAVSAVAVVPLSGTRYGIYSAAGSTDLAVYAFGYFAPAATG